MIIQNKMTGRRMEVTPEEFETLKAVGFGGKWIIITRDDKPKPSKTLPMEIIDFTKKKKRKNGRQNNRNAALSDDQAV